MKIFSHLKARVLRIYTMQTNSNAHFGFFSDQATQQLYCE